MREPTRDGYAAMASAASDVAKDLATAGAGVIAYACTVGSLSGGREGEVALEISLAMAAGVPAISLADASMMALRAVGATRIAILTPYSAETNAWVADYATSRGFAVAAMISMPVGIATVGDLSPAAVVAIAAEAMANCHEADALWIPCTAVQTLDAIAAIEAVTRRPAISGSQALLWRALALLGIEDPIRGAGRLFAER
jgi:maleate isomerase